MKGWLKRKMYFKAHKSKTGNGKHYTQTSTFHFQLSTIYVSLSIQIISLTNMKTRIIYLLLLAFFLAQPPVYSQFTKGMNYAAETGISFSDGEYTPFWLTANKYGLSSVQKNNGYLRAGIFRPFEEDKRFSYSFGLDLAGAYNYSSSFVVQQAYIDLKYYFLGLSVGSKERPTELKNKELSSGGMTFSSNARSIPQVRIGIPEYIAIPGTKQFFSIKGHIAYGMFTDDKWQENFVSPGNRYTKHALYHSKALFAKIGNEEKFPLVFEGGIEMAAQFGGRAYNIPGFDPYMDMPNGIKDFFKVFIPSGSDATDGAYSNVYGNHLGSWNFSLSYKFTDWKIRAYYEHFFEDHSMMFGEYGWKDCLAGVEITLPKNPIIGSFVYEYLGTKDQSGPIYHDHTPEIPDQISARDNYYNHGIFTGWQHWGMGIGNPLLMSPIYNKDGNITFKSNRVKAHHFGISGQPIADISYRILVSTSRNWGTYSNPFTDIKKNTSTLLEVNYIPHQLKGWQFTGSFAFDRGDMIGDNTGAMITIRKTGLLTK